MNRSKVLVSCAIGKTYEAQSSVMMQSFLEHNPGWETRLFTEDILQSIIPAEWQHRDPFNLCEIGRWLAVKRLLAEGYDTVLYVDNDLYFYGDYQIKGYPLVLYPHYVTWNAAYEARSMLYKDGIPNIGIMEFNQVATTDYEIGVLDNICDFIYEETFNDFSRNSHEGKGWFQNIFSYLPGIFPGIRYNPDPSHDVAYWNLKHHDRILIEGKYGDNDIRVLSDGGEYLLKSFHFSNHCMKGLEDFPLAQKLRDVYIKRVRELAPDYMTDMGNPPSLGTVNKK